MKRGRRPGFLYEFWGYDPRALLCGHLKKVYLYVGQTRQKPENRWKQHQFGAPNGEPGKVWWPLVTDKRVVYSKMFVSDWKLDLREAMRIARRTPLANIKLNSLNTKRIPPWEMKRLMLEINRRGGVTALVAKAQGQERSAAGWSMTPERVIWYGNQADRIGAQWHKQSTGSSSSSDWESEESSESMWKKLVSGFTGHARV